MNEPRVNEEYRDELAAAHRRIEALEAALQGRLPPRPRSAAPRFAIGLAVCGIVGIVGAFSSCAYFSLSRSATASSVPYAPYPGADTAPLPPRLYASWYTQNDVLPTLVDVDGDGTKDIVGLFWRSGSDEAPLYAAAIDGKTFTLKWSAGPYPSQWASTRTHLAVAGDKVVLTDSQEDLVVLELKDGTEVRSSKVLGGVTQLCALGDGSARAVARSAAFPGESNTTLLDLASGSTGKVPASASCPSRHESCWAVRDGRPCETWGALASAPREAQASPARRAVRTFQEADRGVTIFAPDGASTKDGRDEPYAVAFVKGSKTPLWKGSLLVEGDEMHFGRAEIEMKDRKLGVFYQTKAGPFRVAVYDAITGERLWSALVPRSQEGSYAGAFGIEDDRVMAVVNHTVHVYDATTGEYLKGLDSGSI